MEVSLLHQFSFLQQLSYFKKCYPFLECVRNIHTYTSKCYMSYCLTLPYSSERFLGQKRQAPCPLSRPGCVPLCAFLLVRATPVPGIWLSPALFPAFFSVTEGCKEQPATGTRSHLWLGLSCVLLGGTAGHSMFTCNFTTIFKIFQSTSYLKKGTRMPRRQE